MRRDYVGFYVTSDSSLDVMKGRLKQTLLRQTTSTHETTAFSKAALVVEPSRDEPRLPAGDRKSRFLHEAKVHPPVAGAHRGNPRSHIAANGRCAVGTLFADAEPSENPVEQILGVNFADRSADLIQCMV
jgi:hypothetical protein